MTRKYTHGASDIEYKYGTRKLDEIRSYWDKYSDNGSFLDLLFLLALEGIDKNNRISLDTEDGEGKKDFSRVVYQRNTVQMESIIGLISMLGNEEEDKEKLLNQIAFGKMDNYQVPFNQLPNTKDFYEHVLGGIDSLHSLLFDIGKGPMDIAASLYDEAMEIEEELIQIAEEMRMDELDE